MKNNIVMKKIFISSVVCICVSVLFSCRKYENPYLSQTQATISVGDTLELSCLGGGGDIEYGHWQFDEQCFSKISSDKTKLVVEAISPDTTMILMDYYTKAFFASASWTLRCDVIILAKED